MKKTWCDICENKQCDGHCFMLVNLKSAEKRGDVCLNPPSEEMIGTLTLGVLIDDCKIELKGIPVETKIDIAIKIKKAITKRLRGDYHESK